MMTTRNRSDISNLSLSVPSIKRFELHPSKFSRPRLYKEFPNLVSLSANKTENIKENPNQSHSNSKKAAFKMSQIGIGKTFFLIRKFARNLKAISLRKLPIFFGKKHFDLINDSSFFWKVWKSHYEPENLWVNFLTPKVSSYLKKYSMKPFESSCWFIILWNLGYLALTIAQFYLIPLELSFSLELQAGYPILIYFQYFSMIFFLLDIIVTCNTAVYIRGRLEKNRSAIIRYYFKCDLGYDIFSLMGLWLGEDLNLQAGNYLKLFFLLKLWNFSKRVSRIEETLFFDESVWNFLALVKLVIQIIFISHIFACFWYLVGNIEPDDSWLSSKSLLSEVWYVKYLNSFYFICITMNTVGYGDVTPQNSFEKCCAIILTYLACGVFAYSLNSIGSIIKEIGKRGIEFQYNMAIVNDYMRRKNVSFELKMRVRKYMEYIWTEEEIGKIDEEGKIFQKLSDSLREELLIEANGGFIKALPLFSLNFSDRFLKKLIPLLQEVRYTPGEVIFSKDDPSNQDLYILLKGEVELYLETSNLNLFRKPTVLHRVQKGEVFGELAFFSIRSHCASARSTDFSTVYRIRKERFSALIHKFERDYQRFCEIRDSCNFLGDMKPLHSECWACSEKGHPVSECPLVSPQFHKQLILGKYQHSSSQQRNTAFESRRTRKVNCLKKSREISSEAIQIMKYHIDLQVKETMKISVPEDSPQEDSAHSQNEEAVIERQKELKSIVLKVEDSMVNLTENSMSKIIGFQMTKSLGDIAEEPDTNLDKQIKSENLDLEGKNLPTKAQIQAEKSMNKFKEFKETRQQSSLKESTKGNQQQPPEFEMIKSWRFYFPHNNIEKLPWCFNHRENVPASVLLKRRMGLSLVNNATFMVDQEQGLKGKGKRLEKVKKRGKIKNLVGAGKASVFLKKATKKFKGNLLKSIFG